DSDAPLVAAWQRHRAIAAGFAGLDARDAEGSQRLADELAACNMLIVETPCHGATGAAVKLRLLAWLHDSGTEAEWEGDLVRSALAVLERGA
ncbi:MAG: hypothetical protein HQL38_11600, partial [Alphaproteobacteria bacterium]|nr:hypothetical protein [Alphaproteobacteria bacterium]